MTFEQYWHLSRNPFDKSLPARDAFATRDFREATSRLDFLARAGGIGRGVDVGAEAQSR